MKNNLSSFTVGFIFAIGLAISGMTNPEKVIGFLNLFHNWDPSLIFVMVGAIAIHFILYKLIRKRTTPLLSHHWHVPQKTKITKSLIAGSFLFGIGWGLAGFCPGPAIVSLASLKSAPIIFILSMMAGMFLFKLLDKKFKFDR